MNLYLNHNGWMLRLIGKVGRDELGHIYIDIVGRKRCHEAEASMLAPFLNKWKFIISIGGDRMLDYRCIAMEPAYQESGGSEGKRKLRLTFGRMKAVPR